MAKPKIDRKTLIQNSLSVFKTKGYNGTSMQDLASANGLLKGSFYHYIESKEALMLEVLHSLKEHYTKRIFAIAYDSSISAFERLSLLAAKAEEVFMFEEGGDFFVNIGLETKNTVPAFAKVIQEFFAEWLKAMHNLFSTVMDKSEAKVKAEIVVAEIEGSVILMKLLDDAAYLSRTNKKMLAEFKKLETQKLVN